MTARYLVGDVFDRMAELPDGSVDLIVTSPPFLALRSYLPDGHPDKVKEIGSESGPAEFVDTLLRLSAEWGRLLAPHGSLCVELGDTYSGSGGSGGDYTPTGIRPSQAKYSGSAARRGKDNDRPARSNRTGGWPLAKSLALVPELYRIGLAYGMNPLTGEPSPAGRWRVRNTVRWVRPNPPVGALGDKFRPATSELVVACKSGDRWFDLDAVRTRTDRRPSRGFSIGTGRTEPDGRRRSDVDSSGDYDPERGAPPLDWWNIASNGYSGSHYAVFPPELVVVPIKSMCPPRVCVECGAPARPNRPCGHDAWRPGLVLDPFAGTGTTLMVATGHGRDAIGIDLDERNAPLALERCGMLLEVDEHLENDDDEERTGPPPASAIAGETA